MGLRISFFDRSTLFNCEIVYPILKFNKNVLKNKIKKVI